MISLQNDKNEFEDFEWHEFHTELLENKDYKGLIEFCKRYYKKYPNDPYAQHYLGEAYVLGGNYDKAIDFLSKHHYAFPVCVS